jgi:hypothetical protein
MGRRQCTACGGRFTPRRNVPDQAYCSKPGCQRERRRRWQREKLKQDLDYRANQAAAQQRWRDRNPGYWRKYRQAHPEYTARNRIKQRERNRYRGLAVRDPSMPAIAKMDECLDKRPIASGTYRLIPVTAPGIAKMDAYLVKMQVLSDAYAQIGDDCKEMT